MHDVINSKVYLQTLWHFTLLQIVESLKPKLLSFMFVNMYMAHINGAICQLSIFKAASRSGSATLEQPYWRVGSIGCMGIPGKMWSCFRQHQLWTGWTFRCHPKAPSPNSLLPTKLHHWHQLPTPASHSANFKLPSFNPLRNQRFERTFNYLLSQHRILRHNCTLGEV